MSIARALWKRREPPPSFVSSRGVWRRLLARRSARAGIIIAGCLGALALIGPALSPYRSDRINLDERLSAPSVAHPLGTDQYGRDQLTRIADGGRRSLGAALLVSGSALVLGLCVGITVGMIGGIIDAATMRVVDILLALPSLVLALAVVGVLGVGFENLMLALVASYWPYYARLARSYVRLARRREDVVVARLAGIGWPRIVVGHVVPGVLAQLMVVATLDLGGVIIGIAGLSFLGLGVQPPDAEWGAMLSESRLFFTTASWLLLAPAAAIFLSVMSANLIGNALRDATDYS